MELRNWVTTPFRFNAIPVSVLTAITFATVFTSVLVTDETPAIPKNLRGLALNQAYNDLHRITARPHPLDSHANDEVRDYLLGRLRPVVDACNYMHLSDDLASNATYYTGADGAAYFEGSNILVKIDGTDSSSTKADGVVFTAHYDSVSTAPGATDDGMGIVTLLQLVHYFSEPKRRPRRTAIIFFNNGEEDGLNGSHMFFEHPWSNLTSTFLNVEGAAAGGRAMLFRATSLAAARSFTADGVTHPHGNVLSQDAFARGVVRSRTDYEVFTQGIKGEKDGLAGLDFAFYKNRAFYHTMYDSIPGMGKNEGRKALWTLMETVRGAGVALLNDQVAGGNEPGVYFDVLGGAMITFSMRALFITHVIFLVVGPISVLAWLGWLLVLSNREQIKHQPAEQAAFWSKLRHLVAAIMGWGRFWFALLVTIGAQVGLVAGYVKINPFVAYSKPYLVLLTTIALPFLVLVFSLSLFSWLWPSPPSSQKVAIILETYLLSWIFLVASTAALNNLQIGGVYLITVWNFCAWLASLLALAEAVARAKQDNAYTARGELDLVGEPEPAPAEEPDRRFVRGVRYEAPAGEENDHVEPEETEPTEITPLMRQHRRHSTGGREYIVGIDGQPILVDASKSTPPEYEELGWWIMQMLALTVAPAVLFFQIAVVLMHSLANTMADGSPPIILYGGLALLSFFTVVNIAPFAHRIHRGLFLPVLVVFVIALAVAWTSFPFTHDAPLKIFFQQSVELSPSNTASRLATNEAHIAPQLSASANADVVRAVTKLTGLPSYLDKRTIPELPSSWGKDIDCSMIKSIRTGLRSCTWESELLPSSGGNTTLASNSGGPQWMSLQAVRLNNTSARLTVQGRNTRVCILYFDNPIVSFDIVGSGARLQPGYELPDGGAERINLFSRTWDKEFVVDVRWAREIPPAGMAGRAACQWAEFASSTASGPHAAISARNPAFEEVLQFLPLWATPTKWMVGLFEAWTRFSV